MIEIDLNTEQGREEAKNKIREIANSENKEELVELLFFLLDMVASHEVKFENLKNI